MERGGKATGSCSHNENALAAGAGIQRNGPVFSSSLVAKKALDGMNTNGTIQFATIAGGFAGVIADPAVYRREWVIPDQPLPRAA